MLFPRRHNKKQTHHVSLLILFRTLSKQYNPYRLQHDLKI